MLRSELNKHLEKCPEAVWMCVCVCVCMVVKQFICSCLIFSPPYTRIHAHTHTYTHTHTYKKQVVLCSFASMGCESKLRRKNVAQHLNAPDILQQHLLLMCQVCVCVWVCVCARVCVLC